MKLQTKFFGQIDYEESQIISFPIGIPGFSNEQKFLLLPFAGSESVMLCLQSVMTPELAFVVLDPFRFSDAYTPVLQPDELQQLGVESSEDLYYFVLCTVRNPVSDSTVNMRCPLAINPNTLVGRQIIMDTDEYDMRYPLSGFGGASC